MFFFGNVYRSINVRTFTTKVIISIEHNRLNMNFLSTVVNGHYLIVIFNRCINYVEQTRTELPTMISCNTLPVEIHRVDILVKQWMRIFDNVSDSMPSNRCRLLNYIARLSSVISDNWHELINDFMHVRIQRLFIY
jgi:hypothetical protein